MTLASKWERRDFDNETIYVCVDAPHYIISVVDGVVFIWREGNHPHDRLVCDSLEAAMAILLLTTQ